MSAESELSDCMISMKSTTGIKRLCFRTESLLSGFLNSNLKLKLYLEYHT